jgi:hypothetical protein
MNMGKMGAFFIELFKRFGLKSPKFFQVLQFIGALCAVITGLPDLLTRSGITLPPEIEVFENKTIAIAGAIMWIISKLPVENPQLVSVKKKLPFSKPKPKEEKKTPAKKSANKSLTKKRRS